MKGRILIVDDEPQVLKLFRSMLEEGGYSVAVACSSDATEALKTLDIDLLVLDLNMPEPDGFELLKKFHTSMPGLRIVVTSGYLEGALLEAAQLLGATATIPKATAPKVLVKTVDAILRKRSHL